ncbi:enolase C-terminal domain-like protein [Streptomyces sp. NRRL S-87]|uniref:enolase C-terminal domain-like protein n=1 Tax=Streptomyces sp. NRRL S-87 TaxID=1463920 RepID=UPI0004C1D318|nr:enolase C-terminal domain-like protein [Streptomyces sp. NRRL S-87]
MRSSRAPVVAGAGVPTVEALHVQVLQFPTDAPEADGTLAWDRTTMLLVQVHGGGTAGLGYGYGDPAAARVITGLLDDVVIGRAVFDVPAVNEAMGRAVRNAGRPGLIAGAVSAVDIALWDLKARVLGLPLADLLGRARDEVPVYGSGGFTTYGHRRLAEQLEGWAGQGFVRFKIKIGEGWGTRERRDLERTERARAVVGGDAELYVDANGAYTRKQAVRVGRTLTGLGVSWFEEPVSSDDLTGLARVRDAVTADVAAGEYGYDLPYFARMLPAVDCLQADATRCGGLTVWLRAAALAQAHGLQLSGHCAPHVHAHAAAAVPNLRHLEWFHDHVRIENLLFDGTLDPAGSAVHPGRDGRPGLGLTIRPDVADRHRLHG